MLDRPPDRSAPIGPGTLLRPGVLDALAIVVAGPPAPYGALADAVAEGCTGLGASVSRLLTASDEDTVRAAAASLPDLAAASVLVCDGAGLLAEQAAAGATVADDGAALSAALAGVWSAVRAVAIPALVEAGRPGRVILIAPPAAGPMADAARAALENLARTLSVEWARHGITVVSVAPGAQSPSAEIAALVAYLASPAGAYYSGCQLDLRGP